MTDSVPYDIRAHVPINREVVALLRDVATTAKRDDHDAEVRENDRRLLAFADECDAILDRLPCAACGVSWAEHGSAEHPFAELPL